MIGRCYNGDSYFVVVKNRPGLRECDSIKKKSHSSRPVCELGGVLGTESRTGALTVKLVSGI